MGSSENQDQRRILLIESSQSTAKVITQEIGNRCERGTLVCSTLAEARALLEHTREEFLAAVVAMELPDAKGTESAETTIRSGLPTIVLSGSFTPDLRRRVWELDIYDYYVKGPAGLSSVCRALNRLPRNQRTKALVVDDSITFRNVQSRLLRAHLFDVVLAGNGEDALAAMAKNPDILLVLTDHEMPGMDGVELVRRLREIRGPDDLAILALSGSSLQGGPVDFLKQGASDYITKPFEKEEFYCRVYNCLDAVETTRAIKRAAYTDALTGVANRLFFFSKAHQAFERTVTDGEPMAVIMMDVDFFKKVNDTYGHAAGDAVLCHVARLAQEILGDRMLVARFGGEEFCALGCNLPNGEAEGLCERLRFTLERSPIVYEGKEILVTISVGLTLTPGKDLDATINAADALLYRAKHTGRNRVVAG